MPLRPLMRIRELVRAGEYEFKAHALREALDDDLHPIDVESALLTGELLRIETDDPRGKKYVVVGLAADLERKMGVVVRLTRQPTCVIITAYEVRQET